MSAPASVQHETASLRPSSVSTKPSPVHALTTFPNAFSDEPEPGLLPAFLSKVKSTFAGTAVTGPATPAPAVRATLERSPLPHVPEVEDAWTAETSPARPAQTEAQRIAAEAKERAAKYPGPITIIPPPSVGSGDGSFSRGSRPGSNAAITPTSPQLVSGGAKSLRPPLTIASSKSGSSRPPSLNPSLPSSMPGKRLGGPREMQWRPSGIAPAPVTVSPVTSVTTVVQSSGNAEAGPSIPHAHRNRAHFALQSTTINPLASSPNFRRHVQRDSLSSLRPRRASLATIPDSPSSVSLSAMIHNSEQHQNASYVPGFPLGQDDTRSIRSLGMVKKTNSVSRIIRRIRGEGLSKHYWMADEHCKECYDCKSVFTAWRRKHHCRICGQIFCSRCASNIIGARRFGQDGAVRVCNLCLKIMEEYRDDEDDDRHSVASMATSSRIMTEHAFPAISPDMPYAKSPFAASQLFSTNPDDTLGAIEEGVAATWSRGGDYSPEGSDDDEDRIYTMRPNTAIPFRRPMDEEQHEESDAGSIVVDDQPNSMPSTPALEVPDDADAQEGSVGIKVTPPRDRPKRVEFPRTDTYSSDGERPALRRIDSNVPLAGIRTRLSSRASQGGLTALIDERRDGLWRARSNSFVKRPETLSGSSLHHFHLMLEQAIARAGLSNAEEWHQTLSGILLKVATNVTPNVRSGDLIDVRAYVKIKKVPGGKISDSEYVDGIVISKNVAHKAMARRLVNPRIMVVTFPLDYHRVEHQFVSLDPIMAQEKDYLRLLTRRIIDVRPHIVLVERSASRLALDHLLEAGIAVARSVKLSAIHQVARCTQADVVASMDRLALEPRLGRCAEFRIQSFDHELIPGRRKTLMRFEGCQREHGCTLILRGADIDSLRKVKIIADFMSLVAYQLKNEVILYSDEHNIAPIRPPLSSEYQQLLAMLRDRSSTPAASYGNQHLGVPESPITPTLSRMDSVMGDRLLERREAVAQTQEIARSLRPYLETILSASAAIRFPPPQPLAKMAELDQKLTTLRKRRDDEEAKEILHEEMGENIKATAVPAAGSGASALVLSDTSSSLDQSTATIGPVAAVKTRDPYRVLRRPEEISRESALAEVQHDHADHLKLWQWYSRRHSVPLRPEDHQGIVYLYSLGCEGGEKPCVEPKLEHINFYQPDDQTVGQFLENLAIDAAKRCPNKACERLLLFHFRLLVHGDRRLQLAIDQFPCPSPGHEEKIITWSYCRLCATPSPTTIIREETWKMSWGAYLEHCFYPPQTSAGFSCPHDAYRDQIRYFAHRNLAIRIHNESIDVYEPVRPSITLQTKPETKVLLKNQEYESALQKIAAFFDSVLFRLRAFDYDICQPEKVGSLKTALEGMLARAVADREELVNLLNRTYKLTPMTDVLALNTVLRTLQDKVVQWDLDFADIEKTYLPTEKDLRRMTAAHLKRLFATQDGFSTLDRNVVGLTVSEADEKEVKSVESEGSAAKEEQSEQDGLSMRASDIYPSSAASATSSSGDGMTPMNELAYPSRSPFSLPPTPEAEDSDSDSTIGAKTSGLHPRPSPGYGLGIESSEMDSDGYFVSRLPRRTKPAASIADLVKRFQESSAQFEASEEAQAERPRSSASIRRSQRHRQPDPSDTDDVPQARPRIRRGKTEQPPQRNRDISRSGMLSDIDRGYAHHASRIPTLSAHRRSPVGPEARPALRSRMSDVSTASAVSGRTSPESNLLAPPSSSRSAGEGKPRALGKGRLSRQDSGGSRLPGPSRPSVKRNLTVTPGNRVTSIARHFDRLSREAERERQKRISIVRNKRARPVSATKVKEQVFDNLRDAFRDEFDTDSSEADNEEDEHGSDDSADSGRSAKDAKRPRSHSPKHSPPKESAPIAVPVTEEPETHLDLLKLPSPVMEHTPASSSSISISGSGQSIASTSAASDARSEMSFTDRLQIDLPSFQTSAPLPSVPATPQLSADTADESIVHSKSHISQLSESEMSSGGERSSILKTLTGLWAFRAGDYTPLEYPLSAAEHLFADSKVIIRENEPTSIIAFTLSSKTYRDKMRQVVGAQKRKVEDLMPEDANIGERSSAWDIISIDEGFEADDHRSGSATHLKYDFDSGSSTIFCRIFFAEQFAALRQACQCEDSFVESLARCVQFDASGGKSGSAFLKTKDDRFICKEISRLEMDALTKFAPAYFEYTRKAFQGQRPTVLAKVYGFFKIGYRNAVTGRAMRMNVLVMENLFYERRFAKIYDLKGSTRNRLIQATGKINEVLLDENLLEIVYKHPLYLREHSKRILRSALFNDTLFLSSLNVMDYSLVVGVDQDRHELVIGIVDYIRTFTWDKKLESWVKDSAFLGGAGKGEPTIVTPKQYKTRFRTAMERNYFLAVPDRWSKIGAEQEADETEAIALTV